MRKTDGSILGLFLCYKNTGGFLLRVSWIKTDSTDIIIFNIWVKEYMLENSCQCFSSIDKNSVASYQLCSFNKQKWLKKYNNILDEQIKYFIITNLLNINEIILEIVHLTANHCCRNVDPTFFIIFVGVQSWW